MHFQNNTLLRYFDFTIALMAIVFLFPLILVLAGLIRYSIGKPVFFRQMRPGQHGQPFTIYKFRTMTEERDTTGQYLPDKNRMTKIGHFLRNTSLDELPELFNVLRGDMRLVGPRPLLMHYLKLYTPEQARRHEVKPGLTGWAQVNGRNAITWEQKFEHDVWYVNNQSLQLDLKIIAMTMWKILKHEGINQPGHSTAEEFKL